MRVEPPLRAVQPFTTKTQMKPTFRNGFFRILISGLLGGSLLLASPVHALAWNTITKTINGNPGWAVVDDTGSNRLVIDSAGNVGIGTSSPSVLLEVAGAIRVGNTSVSCGGSYEGALRYNSTTKYMQLCNASTWVTLRGNDSPTATSMSISGTEEVGKTLTGAYSYSDTESDPEGTTTLQWYTADDAQGANQSPISGATSNTYNLTASEVGKFVLFGVNPKATNGTLDGGLFTVATSSAITHDTTPESFSFTDQTNVGLSTLTTSNSITITGITTGTAVSVTGDGSPEISIEGGAWATSGTITNNQSLQVRLTSNASFSTSHTATITVGTANDTWSVTTLAADTTPNAFSFTDQTNVATSTLITSNSLTITGINTSTSVSVSGDGSPQIQIAGGAWGTSGTIENNQSLRVRLTSNSNGSTLHTATVNVGGVTDAWGVTTEASTLSGGQTTYKLVFITSGTYDGNLGGFSGADAKCQAEADANSLGGTYKAWLSNKDDTISPNKNFTQATVPYKKVDGTTVASDYSDLVDSTIDSHINVYPNGNSASSSSVWTNTHSSGNSTVYYDSSYNSHDCSGWSSTSGSAVYGANYNSGWLLNTWTWVNVTNCDSSLRLFCFEQ